MFVAPRKVTFVKYGHVSKALEFILVTVEGMVKEVKRQPPKAPLPIVVTLEGIVIVVIDKPTKAYGPMDVTVLGMTVFVLPNTSVFVAFSMIALQLSRESNASFSVSTTIDVKRSLPTNACSPMVVTLAGIAREESLLLLKAREPILVNPDPSVSEAK